ncbi:hypothetical protein [Isoptericola variabilis]|uniref:Integral membrane protein n=1 Tax=Isoptericola variabilis (strain 225) TaxID=743718 RepID=F6FWW6_ISOV2|nr:hypothetical protein [Isoptericola variabilis]AEG43538.1 hypothetical protein Isova_0752 [Isoptericola variabilis 225]TWH32095.1 hypothetical protein L600_000200001190 [Isoptericola variabilis J7]
MEFLYNVVAVLHFVGWAIVLGGYLASLRTPGLYRGVFHGAATALVAGAVMMGLLESGAVDAGFEVDRTKLTVKLLVALVIAVLAFLAKRQGAKRDNGTGPVTPGLKHTIGALTLVNIVVAVFW